MNSSSPENPNGKKYSPVFIYSAIVVAIVVLLGAFLPEQFNYVTNNIKMWITEKLGWYYLILTTIIVFFCIFLIFSPIGKLKLGKPNDKPEFNTISWFAMLFSAGMGIGLVFYGAAEPMAHFATPPTADPKTTEAYTEALRSTFFHWGFHAWAVYGVVALALAYSQFRKGEPGYDEYASKIVDVIKYLINTIPKIRKNLRHAIEMLNVKKKEFLSLIPNVTCNYIKTKLEELDNTLGKWEPFLNDLKAVSPILDNHLDDIVKNMKPLIVQMIFEPSHYDDMFISRKALTPVFSSVL
ncbi:BCCT family transporter [Staphylococcus aureus]